MWVSAALVSLLVMGALSTPCEEAHKQCAFRTGCGAALSNYMYLCGDVLNAAADTCPEQCEHALIALTSTDQGKQLMSCHCEDDYCKEAKSRIEVCRSQVVKGAANPKFSCRLSQLICLADAQCATALDYYNRLCRSVFRGKKCSNKCLNSIEILRKQEKAAALTACRCDGNEDYDCPRMQDNIARLCFHKHTRNRTRIHDREHEKKHKTQHQELPSSALCLNFTKTLIILGVLLAKYS